MSFASPLFLIGLAAVAIPIWLHLRRRRETVIHFPAIEILARVANRRHKKIRLRSLLLLALRILVIAVAVLAMSRPGITVSRPGGIRSGLPIGLVLVIDDSLSMRARLKNGSTVFDTARTLAIAEIDRLRPGDGVAVILSGHPIRPIIGELTFDLDAARHQITAARAGFYSGDLSSALLKAFRILRDSPLTQREVVVITDLSEGAGNDPWPPWPPGDIGFRILDAFKDGHRSNVAVDQVQVRPSPQGEAREALIEARIANYTNKVLRNFDIVLEVAGAEVARGSIDVQPRDTAIKRFYHRFPEEGIHRGLVRIEPDNLEEDNIRHFSVLIRHSISALIIDGDYRPGSYRDEAFYLHRALETPIPEEVPIHPFVLDVSTAQSGPLTGNDVVFFVGIVSLDTTLAKRLIDYVKKGGGLFVSPGPASTRLDPIASILPAKVRSVRQASRADRPFRIAAINRAHPIFSPFKDDPTGLEKTSVKAHLLVEPEPTADRNTLIELMNGLPLLIERAVGRGRVMMLATTVDREWTDLPIRPGFLPLIQRTARHLAGRLDDGTPRRILAGQAIDIEVSRGMQRLIVRGPKDKDTIFPAADLVDRPAIRFNGTHAPGHYQVWAEIPEFGGLRELHSLGFVVESDPAECNPARVVTAKDQTDIGNFAPLKGRLPIWPFLLIATVLLIISETWVAGQGLKRSHLIRPSFAFQKSLRAWVVNAGSRIWAARPRIPPS
ncbi:MAG: BatA domain-containing protein [Myxococcota bacterium]|nr:BatA domain-containing protein [Myxococcota bacterium]